MQSRNLSYQKPFVRTYTDGTTQTIYRAQFSEVFSCAPGGSGNYKDPNNHYFQKTESKAQVGWAIHSNTYPPFSWSSSGPHDDAIAFPDWTVPANFETAVYNQALSELNDSVRGGLDLSVDGFQAQMTKKMLVNAFHVVDYARNLRRGWTSGKFGRTKTFAGLWLEYTYGWKPFVGSMYDAAQELFDPSAFMMRYQGKSKLKWNWIDTSMGFMNLPMRKIYNCSLRCKIGVTLTPPAKTSQDLSRFTSLNPASIAWELLPYSFVVDWFYNLGDYLRNAETGLIYGSTFKNGYQTISERTDCVRETIGSINSAGNVTTAELKGGWTRVRSRRTILQAYPLPRVPVINVSLGTNRLISAASLLAQFLGRR